MKEQYILTIKADDRPGLLHLVTGMINRRLIGIESLNAAKTDINSIVLITIELNISEKALSPLLLKLENIIEVFAVEAIKSTQALCQRSAYYKLNKTMFSTPQVGVINKYNAQIVNIHTNSVLISKSGNDAIIRQLYNALDGPYLLGFSQTGLITDSSLITHEDIERISWLAA